MTADGLIVYNVTFADAGRYECIGTELKKGTTITKDIRVDVVSKCTSMAQRVCFIMFYKCRNLQYFFHEQTTQTTMYVIYLNSCILFYSVIPKLPLFDYSMKNS